METWLIVTLCIVGGILLLAIIGYIVLSIYFAKIISYRYYDPTSSVNIPNKNEQMEAFHSISGAYESVPCEEHSIKSKDNLTLKGYLYKSQNPSNVFVLFAHGYRSFENHAEVGIYDTLWHKDHDYNVFAIDQRAHGNSEGKWIAFGELEANDVLLWINYLIEKYGQDIQIILHGHSMGATTIGYLLENKLPNNVKFAIIDCPFETFFQECLDISAFPKGITKFVLQGTNLHLKLFHHINIKKKVSASVAKSTLPMLFIHGELDTFVPTINSSYSYNASHSIDKKRVIFPNTLHATSYIVDPKLYTENS